MKRKIFIFLGICLLIVASIIWWERATYRQVNFEATEFFSLQTLEQLNGVSQCHTHGECMESGFFLLRIDREKFDSTTPMVIIPDFYVQNDKIRSKALFYQGEDVVTFDLVQWHSIKHLHRLEQDYLFFAHQKPQWTTKKSLNWKSFLSFLFYSDFFSFTTKVRWSFWDFLSIRDTLLPVKGRVEYQIFQWGNRQVLFLHPSQEVNSYYIVMLDNQEFPVYRFVGSRNRVKQVMLKYFSAPEWLYSNHGILFPTELAQFTPFSILDFFTFKHLLSEHRMLLERFTISYLKQILLLAQSDNYLKKHILMSLKKILILQSLKGKDGSSLYSTEFKQAITNMLNQQKDILRD